jgi:hypothetical protein
VGTRAAQVQARAWARRWRCELMRRDAGERRWSAGAGVRARASWRRAERGAGAGAGRQRGSCGVQAGRARGATIGDVRGSGLATTGASLPRASGDG